MDTFRNCLNESDLEAYSNLVSVCDEFIKANYPGEQLDDGYQKFLDGLLSGDPDPKSWKIDSLRIIRMNMELAKTFGVSYNVDKANFLFESSITQCLVKANKKRVSLKRIGLARLLEDKKSTGELSPYIIAGAMQANKISPTIGIGKTVFVDRSSLEIIIL